MSFRDRMDAGMPRYNLRSFRFRLSVQSTGGRPRARRPSRGPPHLGALEVPDPLTRPIFETRLQRALGKPPRSQGGEKG